MLISTIRIHDVANVRRLAPGRDPDIEVILTMRRRRMHEACTGIICNMIAREHGDGFVEKCAHLSQWVPKTHQAFWIDSDDRPEL